MNRKIGLGFVIVSVFSIFYFCTSSRKVEYVFYPNLSKKYISDNDLEKVGEIHAQCFEDVRRRKLFEYFMERDSSAAALGKVLLQQRIDQYMEKMRVKKLENLARTENMTVAKKSSEIIGFYNCVDEDELTDNSIMIYNVCLSSKWRGKGLGKALVSHAIETCKKPNRDLTLTVYKDDLLVIKLYETLGFHRVTPGKPVAEDFNFFGKYLMRYLP